MKLSIRLLTKFLVAACTFAIVISVLSGVVIPSLCDYAKNTLPESKNLEINSSISPDPDKLHSPPVDGTKFETGDYVYTFVSSLGGWKVSVKDKTQSSYENLCETIYNVPIVSLYKTFEGCTKLTTAPAIPYGVVDMSSAFSGCASLSGVIVVHATPGSYSDCFSGTIEKITLSGGSGALALLQSTSSNGNIYVK